MEAMSVNKNRNLLRLFINITFNRLKDIINTFFINL